MSAYWKAACRTCNVGIDMSPYTDEAVIRFTGEFMRYEHIGHDVVLYSDLSDDEGTIEDSLKDVVWKDPEE